MHDLGIQKGGPAGGDGKPISTERLRHPGDLNEVLGRSSRPHSISSSWRWKQRAILGEALWGAGCT